MSFQLGRGFHNPLVRRLRRHSRLTTLFRAPQLIEPVEMLSSGPQTYGGSTDSPGVIQATLGGIEETTPPVPELSFGQQTRETRTTSPTQRVPVRPSPVRPAIDTSVAQPAVSPPRVARSTEQKTTPVASDTSSVVAPARETAPTALPVTPPARTESDATITDSVWRRLQTIFRRHQNTPIAATESSVNEPDVISRQEVAQPLQTAPEEGASAPAESAPTGEAPSPQQTLSPMQTTPRPPAATIQRSVEPEIVTQPINVDQEEHEVRAEVTQSPVAIESTAATVTHEKPANSSPIQRSPKVSSSEQEAIPDRLQLLEEDRPQEMIPPSTAIPVQPPLQPRSDETSGVPAIPHAPTSPVQLSEEQHESILDSRTQDTTPAVSTSPAAATVIQRKIESPVKQDESARQQGVTAKLPVVEDLARDHEISQGEVHQLDVETTEQMTPLQDVWQVERLTRSPRSTQPAQAAPSPPQPFHPVQQEHGRPSHDLQENINRVLNSIAAGGPTSSSIEVVAPRHPRPVVPQVLRRPQQPTIMREPAAPQVIEQDISSEQGTRIPPAEVVVDTAIGPLPADLWTLIDEPVPARVRRQQGSVERDAGVMENIQSVSQPQPVQQDHRETPPRQAAVLRQTMHVPEPNLPPSPSLTVPTQKAAAPSVPSITPAPSRIQRVPDLSGNGGTSSDTAQRSTAELGESTSGQVQEEEPSSEESGVDIDDLARKVYEEIKRKLAVEWERLRTRF